MIVYKITCVINNKSYIGQTKEPLKTRMSRHFGYQSRDHDTKFYRAIRKYGKENFTYCQIDSADSQEELDSKEVYWINFYNSVEAGYNSNNRKGRVGGDTLSDHPNLLDISKKISASKTGGLNPNAKKVRATNVLTGEFYVYNSYSECQRELELPNHNLISKRCLGITIKPYRGIWQFSYA